MALKGHLASVISQANTNVTVYTVPTGIVTTGSISIVNTGSTDSTFKMYITKQSTPRLADMIECDTVITPGGVLERTCMPLGEGEKIVVNASSDALAIRVAGYEGLVD